jgi:hypothetical protein
LRAEAARPRLRSTFGAAGGSRSGGIADHAKREGSPTANRATGLSIFLLAFAIATAPQAISAADSVAVGGSLVLVAPTKDGLIVAADSRVQIGAGDFCDSHHKIVEPSRPDRTVLAVVGGGMQIAAPPADVPDPCAYIRQAPRYVDIWALARNYLESSGAKIATMETDQLAALCVETIATFQKTRAEDIRGFWGKRLFAVILASYEPAERKSIVKVFGVRLRANGEPFASDKETLAVGPASRPTMSAFGEPQFLQKQVVNGPGKQFLSGGFKEWQEKTRTADIGRSLALKAAVDLIEAASKTVDLLRYETTIGGPVDAVLLGDPARPQRLRWKAP